jgi:hypothetical protein
VDLDRYIIGKGSGLGLEISRGCVVP